MGAVFDDDRAYYYTAEAEWRAQSRRGAKLIEANGDVSIIAATPALLDAEDQSGTALAAALAVLPPPAWPPLYNGPETRAWMRRVLADNPGEPGYGSWYVVGDGQLVGIAGYKGPPDGAGTVEIGYSIIEAAQRRGYATAAVRLLLTRAFRDTRVSAVRAETLPDLVGSRAVLDRCDFVQVGQRTDAEDGTVLMYAIGRQPGQRIDP